MSAMMLPIIVPLVKPSHKDMKYRSNGLISNMSKIWAIPKSLRSDFSALKEP